MFLTQLKGHGVHFVDYAPKSLRHRLKKIAPEAVDTSEAGMFGSRWRMY